MAKKKSPSSICVSKGHVLQSLFKWDDTAASTRCREHMAREILDNEPTSAFNRYLKILRSNRYG